MAASTRMEGGSKTSSTVLAMVILLCGFPRSGCEEPTVSADPTVGNVSEEVQAENEPLKSTMKIDSATGNKTGLSPTVLKENDTLLNETRVLHQQASATKGKSSASLQNSLLTMSSSVVDSTATTVRAGKTESEKPSSKNSEEDTILLSTVPETEFNNKLDSVDEPVNAAPPSDEETNADDEYSDDSNYEEHEPAEEEDIGPDFAEDGQEDVVNTRKDQSLNADTDFREDAVTVSGTENGHFFFHLVIIAFLVAVIYITYHNKRKIFLLVQSRRWRDGLCSKQVQYHRLDQNVNEAMPSLKITNEYIF